MFYIITVALSIIIIAVSNVIFIPAFTLSDVIGAFISVSIGAACAFIIDALSALIIRRLTPKRWYLPCVKLFEVSKAERNFYNKLKIKSWKDHVPELGGFTDFHKDSLKSQSDTAYLERFIIEANYGVVIHIFNALLGFLVMLVPLCSAPGIWIPVFAVNFILSILPVFILRHTSYTLLRLYKRSLNKA
jgi:hypothetical protein